MKQLNVDTVKGALQNLWRRSIAPHPQGGFHLMSYFTLTSLIAFTVVVFTLYVLQNKEEAFFEQVEAERAVAFANAQRELSMQQEATAREGLLAVHEAGHVNLTRVLANTLWRGSIAPVMAHAQQIPTDHCRVLPANEDAGRGGSLSARRSCFAEIGRRITALPGFASLDARAHATVQASTVFKIKVFDLRGITIYSSEHSQIGEDKSDNLGWKTAVKGQPASELTHRDRFSAFEGVVENRDLISSYVPVRVPGENEIVGVFEIYSDVTPFLNQINDASTKVRQMTAANQEKVERAAATNQAKVSSSSIDFLTTVGGMLTLLYASLWLLVRNGQRIIDEQRRAQEHAARRQQQWHREKMAALATMAAHVSHEIGNPLTTISGLAEDIAGQQESNGRTTNQPRLIVEQTQRIAMMMRQIADFAATRSEKPELVDINPLVKSACDFLGFDSRFRSTRIEFLPDRQLPACVVIADHFNEVLMSILQACVEGESKPARILVRTSSENMLVLISIFCEPAPVDAVEAMKLFIADSRFDLALREMAQMGGNLQLLPAGFAITLPTSAPGHHAIA